MEGGVLVSVVVATHNRSARLERLLDALRDQTLGPERFEVVVVDDASSDDTPAVLAEQQARGDLALRVIHRERSSGPGAARNAGWRDARAPVVAFTDDDCRPSTRWLEEGLRVIDEHAPADVVVQGRITHDPEEADRLGPFSRSLGTLRVDGWFPTANMLYPRDLLEWLGGFDETTFTGPGGEDTDLGWRATYHGVPVVFSEEALVWHCVHVDGPLGRLRFATRWAETMACFALHPELRRNNLVRGLFWKEAHYHLTRTVLALMLPRPLRWFGAWCAWRYSVLLWRRAHRDGDGEGGGPLLMPYYLVEDALETITAARGGLRYRTPVL